MLPKPKLFFGGPIYTMNPEQAKVEALMIQGGSILAVGRLKEVRERFAFKVEDIDLEGRALLPGFHDSHVHLAQHSLS